MKWLRNSSAALALLVLTGFLALWGTTRVPADRMFRGKLESEWIAEVKYYDEEQAEQWKQFGEEGIEVLLRGLERAERPRERLYRKWYRKFTRFIVADMRVPVQWTGKLPQPKPDETSTERHRIVSLLNGLDEVAYSAAPSMISSLNDENLYVRQSTMGYFSGNEQDTSPLDHLSNEQRLEVFHYLVAAMTPPTDSGLRNNASLVLRYLPEEKETSVPLLLNVLTDKENYARCAAATTLFIIAPEEANTVQMADALIEMLNNPDDQIATRVPELLAKMTVDQERIVDELIKQVKMERDLVPTGAARALGGFPDYAERIVPVLWEARSDPEHRVRTWGIDPSLTKLDPDGAAEAGLH